MSEANAVPNQAAKNEKEYITQNDLESFEGRIIASLSRKIDELIESKVEHKLREERKIRNGQIATLTNSVDELTNLVNDTNSQLTGINAKFSALESIPDLIRDVSLKVAALSATIDEREKFAKVETQRLDERNQEQDHRLDVVDNQVLAQTEETNKIDSQITVIFTKQSLLFTGVNTLRNTIHGDPTIVDGTPSLFGLIEDMQLSLDAIKNTNEITSSRMFVLSTSNANAISGIQSEMARQAVIWRTRKENAMKLIISAVRNPYILGGSAITGGAVAGRSWLKDVIVSISKLLE